MHTETRIGVSVGLRARKCMHLRMHTDCIQSAYKHIKSKEERNSSSTSSYTVRSSIFYCLCLRAIIFYCPCLRAFTDSIRPHCPFIRIRVAATFGGYGRPPAHATCMHCMHQKTDYACYARTQLRKRLHTMHTETRIGVSVGLRARKCMHLRMHTDCIQSAYKHIKSKEERNSSSTSSYTVRSSIFYCLCLRAIIFYCPCLRAFTDSIRPHCPFIRIRVAATFGGYGRPPAHATCMHCMHQKTDYACYARTQLRKRLHTMHTETRIGVSVGLRARKCMQLGMHTDCIQNAYKCIQAYKKRKERIILLTSSLYCLFFHLPLFASSGIPRRTMNTLHCLLSRTVGFFGLSSPV